MLPAVLALPTPLETVSSSLIVRQSCAATCGNVCYSQATIDTAVSNGYSLYQSDSEEGSSDYPHTYNDYEGFTFPVDGPYQEYPILKSHKAYSGGSPGADRVIFNTDGEFAGVITHTGASGDDFVSC